MTDSEKLIIRMLNRLFWLITSVPGVARYSTDVRMFLDADSLAYPERKDDNDKCIAGYEKGKS